MTNEMYTVILTKTQDVPHHPKSFSHDNPMTLEQAKEWIEDLIVAHIGMCMHIDRLENLMYGSDYVWTKTYENQMTNEIRGLFTLNKSVVIEYTSLK